MPIPFSGPALLVALFSIVSSLAAEVITGELTGRARLGDYAGMAVEGVPSKSFARYQRPIEGDFAIQLAGLPPSAALQITLGNAELGLDEDGRRIFSVAANGAVVVEAFDMHKKFGLQTRADLMVQAKSDAKGRLELAFRPARGRAQLAFLTLADEAGAMIFEISGEALLARRNAGSTGDEPLPVVRVPEAARIAELAMMLGEKPYVPGRPADDRAAWMHLGAEQVLRRFITVAERDLTEPTPVLTQELYDLYITKGTRHEYERPFAARTERLSRMTLAECVENNGRFLSAIETELTAILNENTWVAPAHAHARGTSPDTDGVDLAVSARAWTLAVVDQWLGTRLKPDTRASIRRELERRVWRPYRESLRSAKPLRTMGWMKGTNNWNAVCHVGVIGSALTLMDKPEDRAEFLAASEIYLKFYISGFTPDGYCSEGVAYWNYGFGSYLFLADAVRQATGGKVDWLEGDKIRAISSYPAHLEIYDGLYPTYADGAPGSQPASWMRDYLERRLNLGRPEWRLMALQDAPLYHGLGATLFGAATTLFAGRDSGAAVPALATPATAAPLRDEFAQAQIFTLRPASGQPSFGVSFKGGHNDEHHNHNDLGSYVVAMGRRTLLLDPGQEVYTSRTFTAKRYDSKVLASYGHPVPLVAGKQQGTGREFAASIVSKTYSDLQDEVVIDLAGGYDVPTLDALTRTFTYGRSAAPFLTVRDEARFVAPAAFGTALITFSQVAITGDKRLIVYEADAAVEVIIDTGGAAFTIKDEVLPENLPGRQKARRLGIDLVKPSVAPFISVTVRPVALPVGAAPAVTALPQGVVPDPTTPRVRIEAETLAVETGGTVEPVERVATSGLALRHWDEPGHTLGWRFTAPRTGSYAVLIRYALGDQQDSLRTATLDDQPLVTARTPAGFAPTGGWSSTADDWREAWLGAGGEAVIAQLTAGEHKLTLRNEKGPLNLDWIELVPLQ